MIDGATRLQIFWRVVLPMVKGGVAATAVLCFIFSWTEFLLSLFLTNSIRTLPVKITTFVTSTGSGMGLHRGARHHRRDPELHLHLARSEAACPRPDSSDHSRSRRADRDQKVNKRWEEVSMSFKKFDQQTFIVDSANAYTNRQISKREFLRRMGLAGVGFFSLRRSECSAIRAACAGAA